VAEATEGPARVVVASTGGERSVSTRDRLRPLEDAGTWPFTFHSAQPFPDPPEMEAILSDADPDAVLILQRVMPSEADLRRLRAGFGLVVADLDDAIYAVPPSVGVSPIVPAAKAALRTVARGSPHASSRRRPLARTLRSVHACVVGNSILARFAGRYAEKVVEIPTTVAPADRPLSARSDPPVLVWIGLPANQQYLRLITAPLVRLSEEADFVLRIVTSAPWAEAPMPVDHVSYSEEAARIALLESTVGLAPLTDDPWTRGKCAMRAIQYGGSGLPCVASPVGITDEVVIHGETGLLARTEDDWLEGLRLLLSDPGRAEAMGLAAWQRVRKLYSNEVAVERWHLLLHELWSRRRARGSARTRA
jgi:hypothetical protein